MVARFASLLISTTRQIWLQLRRLIPQETTNCNTRHELLSFGTEEAFYSFLKVIEAILYTISQQQASRKCITMGISLFRGVACIYKKSVKDSRLKQD